MALEAATERSTLERRRGAIGGDECKDSADLAACARLGEADALSALVREDRRRCIANTRKQEKLMAWWALSMQRVVLFLQEGK